MYFEAIMLICFGFAWPASIYKSYTSRQNAGKSLHFLVIIFIGYLAGIVYKLAYSYDNTIYLYALNTVLVGIDISIYFRNKYRFHRWQNLLKKSSPARICFYLDYFLHDKSKNNTLIIFYDFFYRITIFFIQMYCSNVFLIYIQGNFFNT